MMPEQCMAIFNLLYNVICVTIYNSVEDSVFSTITDPVWVKARLAIMNSEHLTNYQFFGLVDQPSILSLQI